MLENVSCTNTVLTVVISGVMRLSDITDAQDIIDNNPQFKAKNYQLWRYENIEDVEPSEAEIRALIDRTDRLMGDKPVFVVAVFAGSPLMFGMARMYQLLADWVEWEVGVFKQLSDAELWLQNHMDGTSPPDQQLHNFD